MIVHQALSKTGKKLQSVSPTPQLDAEILLSHVLNKPREWILTHPEYELSPSLTTNYQLIITRRTKNEPVAYITGHKEFYGLDFCVDRRVLIPRPETELMVERGLELLRNKLKNKHAKVIDVGTGSGAVIVSVAEKLKDESKPTSRRSRKLKVSLFAIDSSGDALKIAHENAKKHKVENGIEFIQSDLFPPQLLSTDYPLLILANLPYISDKEYRNLDPSVKNFEPREALVSGIDGLDHYRKLFDQIQPLATNYQLPATILCEISNDQKAKIKKEILARFPTAKIKFYKDLAGKWRLVEIHI